MISEPVKDFIARSYQLVSASSPRVPLQGSDNVDSLFFFNKLLQYYSGTALMITVPKEINYNLSIGQQFVTFGDPTYVPTPDVTEGRLANLQNAWLLLDGVTYPLLEISRNVFYSSYKYFPLQGLPRFAIIQNQVDLTQMEIYPSPSQVFELIIYAKFQLGWMTQNADMSLIPQYCHRWLMFALAKDLAFFKGRSEAWTPKLQKELDDAEKDIIACSAINLTIQPEHDSYLNGSWRVRAGI
jgi:hypothetical protein